MNVPELIFVSWWLAPENFANFESILPEEQGFSAHVRPGNQSSLQKPLLFQEDPLVFVLRAILGHEPSSEESQQQLGLEFVYTFPHTNAVGPSPVLRSNTEVMV